jgi:hypothetical protein
MQPFFFQLRSVDITDSVIQLDESPYAGCLHLRSSDFARFNHLAWFLQYLPHAPGKSHASRPDLPACSIAEFMGALQLTGT